MNSGSAAHGWRFYFGELVASYAGVKRADSARPRVASHATREMTDATTMKLVQVLREDLGFKVLKPANLSPKHMQAWADWMNARRQTDRLPPTLARYATCIRKLVTAAEKPELVEVFERHLDPKTTTRRLVTDQDKTFEGNGVDVQKVIAAAWEREPWVAMTLVFQDAFGARRREACMGQPLADFDLGAGVVHIRRAKGGRDRDVPIRTDAQRAACEQLISFVRWRNLASGRLVDASTALAPPSLHEDQALQRYSDVCKAIGLTKKDLGVVGHGLRSGYVCRLLEDMGITAVVKGGSGRLADPVQTKIRLLIASEHMGHSRANIVGAYAGSPYVGARLLASEYLRERGLLVPGKDARSVDINAQRITDYLEAVREELARERAQHCDDRTPSATEAGRNVFPTSGVFQTVRLGGIENPGAGHPLAASNAARPTRDDHHRKEQ